MLLSIGISFYQKFMKTDETVDSLSSVASTYMTNNSVDAFGERGLESWPMFPGRRVHRVLESDEFDGRVSFAGEASDVSITGYVSRHRGVEAEPRKGETATNDGWR